MKLNEFKKPKKVDEGFWDAVVGDKAVAAVKSMGKGISTQDQMVTDRFVNNFVSDAISSLRTGVNGGLINPKVKSKPQVTNPKEVPPPGPETKPVDPAKLAGLEIPAGQRRAQAAPKPANSTTTATQQKPVQQPTARQLTGLDTPAYLRRKAPTATPGQPAPAPSAKAAAAQAVPKVNAKQQQQNIKDMNAYVSSAAKTLNSAENDGVKMAMAKELVNYMADRKGYPEWQNGLGTVQQVIKKAGLDPNFAKLAVNRVRTGQQMTEAQNIYFINKLLEAIDITWEELGLVVLKESDSKYIIAESKYYALNNLFENILSEAVSVGDYMKNWFAKYMGDVDYTAYKDDINKLLLSIEQNYPKVKPQMTKLGQMVYSISKQAGIGSNALSPDKSSDATSTTAPAGTQATKRPRIIRPNPKVEKIQQDIENLHKTNPNAFKQLQQKMGTLK